MDDTSPSSAIPAPSAADTLARCRWWMKLWLTLSIPFVALGMLFIGAKGGIGEMFLFVVWLVGYGPTWLCTLLFGLPAALRSRQLQRAHPDAMPSQSGLRWSIAGVAASPVWLVVLMVGSGR